MKFIYTGEAPTGSIRQYDHDFVPGEPVEVTDPTAIEKLKSHKFFDAVEEPATVTVELASETATAVEVAPRRVKKKQSEPTPPEDDNDGNADST